MAKKNMNQLEVGDSVKLPGFDSYVKINAIREDEDKYIVEFTANNTNTDCKLLKAMLEQLEPFDVKPVTRN